MTIQANQYLEVSVFLKRVDSKTLLCFHYQDSSPISAFIRYIYRELNHIDRQRYRETNKVTQSDSYIYKEHNHIDRQIYRETDKVTQIVKYIESSTT